MNGLALRRVLPRQVTLSRSASWLPVVVVVVGYYVGCLVGFALRFPASGISFLWPPTTVLTAALLVSRQQLWLALVIGALAAHAPAHVQIGVPAAAWIVQFSGNAVQALLAAFLIRRYTSVPALFRDFRSVAVFIIGACIVAPMVASIVPASVYVGLNWAPDLWQAWRARTISNAVASLTLIPPMLFVWQHFRSKPPLVTRRKLAEFALVLAGILAVNLIAVYVERVDTLGLSLSLYSPIPFLLWATVRFGAPGLSCTLLCTVLLTISNIFRGEGAFNGLSPADTVVALQLFIAFTAVPLMLMAGLLEENRTEHRLLVDAEQQNSAILRAIPDLMFLQTRDGVYLKYYARNPADLLVPPATFIGKHMRDVLPPDVTDGFASAFRQVSTEEPQVAEYSLEMNGEPRRYEARFIGLDRDRVLSIVRDITDRVRSQTALTESQRRFSLATAAGGVGVWDLNLKTGELYTEPSLDAALGYPDQETRTQMTRWRTLIYPQDVDELRSRVAAHASGTIPAFEAEHRMVHRDGSIRWFITRGEVVEHVDGKALRMMGTYTDVTQRKQAEEALAQANATLARVTRISTLAELTASIAHELKQPLCAIVANANACLRWLDTAGTKADFREALNALVNDSHRASEIVTRTRELFANQNVQSRALDLNDAIHDVLELAQPRLKETGVVVHLALDHRLPLVWVDELQIRQVLLNLVLNGVDSMRGVTHRRRTLRVQSRRGKHCALVSVCDTGEGFGKHDPRRVFDAFYTTKPEGLGMGLTISRSIIQGHGGSIWAVTNINGGATFRFRLPVVEEAHA